LAAEAAEEAASAAEDAAAAASAAAEAAASGAAAGGVVSAGAGASDLLPQALSTNAAAIAQKASLVFIYRYPRIIKEKIKAERVVLAHYPNVDEDFRGFCCIFISLFLDLERL
jgi:hypothetical protein